MYYVVPSFWTHLYLIFFLAQTLHTDFPAFPSRWNVIYYFYDAPLNNALDTRVINLRNKYNKKFFQWVLYRMFSFFVFTSFLNVAQIWRSVRGGRTCLLAAACIDRTAVAAGEEQRVRKENP